MTAQKATSEEKQTPVRKKGGARPGSGRKLVGATPLDAKLHIRLEVRQRTLFTQLGGVKWLRGVLDRIEGLLKSAVTPPADLESPEVIGVLPQMLEPILVERAKAQGDVDDVKGAALANGNEVQAGASQASAPLRATGLRVYDAAEVLYGRKTAAGERRSERRIFLLRAAGDAMIDAGICAGDIVVVDAARTPKSGDIACVRMNGALLLRRIFFSGSDPAAAGDLRLLAENSFAPYAAIEEKPWQRIAIEGTVVSAVKPLVSDRF